jgi:thiosulfate reductase / polysulfide reductase chain A
MDVRTGDSEGIETKKVICWSSPGCSSGCGLLVQVKDGKIVKMRGNPDYPDNLGGVCKERFPHLLEWLDHPAQLMYPLKRRGERGEGGWDRISWDQALDEIAAKLTSLKAQYGPETLSVIEGTYRSALYGIRSRFLNLFGNPHNVGAPGTSCACNKVALNMALAGANIPGPIKNISSFSSKRCFVFCGSNIPASRPIVWRNLKKQLEGNSRPKLICIDPRKTEIAENADFWLQIRPGTDAALFMAWLNVIIEEGLYDKEFVEKWTSGFDQLRQRAAEYTPEKVAPITWLPVEQIRESARLFAHNTPGFITTGLAQDHFGLNSIRVEQAKLCLTAITGNLRAEYHQSPVGPGPIIHGKYGIRDSMLQLEDRCTLEQRKKQLGSDRFKLMTWPAWEIVNKYYQPLYGVPLPMSGHCYCAPEPLIWRAILESKPYPIKALITWSSSPLTNAANTKLVYKAFKSPNLELHVVLEHVMTPTAMLADYVLPAASKFEIPVLSTHEDFASSFVAGERAIQPLGERRPDYYFFRELARRLGFAEYFPWETEEDLADYRLKPLGLTFKEVARGKSIVVSDEPWTYQTLNPKTGKPTGFATPSGKFELYSNVMKELGYDPLPFYEEPPESPVRTPEVAREYPLILITGGRWNPQFHSEHRQLGMGMREQHPDPLMDIHPETAAKLGLRDGDWAYIETRRGVIKQKVRFTTGIDPRVVNVQHEWWFPEQPPREPWLGGMWESNANVLTMDDPDACDQLTGSWPARALLCKVYKVLTP